MTTNPETTLTIPAEESLYEYTLRLTRVDDFGIGLTQILEGERPVPASGARIDIAFAGESTGRLAGTIEGVDYVNVRADGRMELDIHATIATHDGARIALHAGGVGLPEPGGTRSRIRYHARLTTADPRYLWVNAIEAWATGEADVATGTVQIRGFVPR